MAETMASANAPARKEPQTSVDTYTPTDYTVQFRRWSQWGNTAYLRGQQAGFSALEVREMQRRGVPIDIVAGAETSKRQMVTK